MKEPHLLRADGPPGLYAPLFRAARAEGLRLGWLEVPDDASDDASAPGAAAPPEAARSTAAPPAGAARLAPPPAPVPERLEAAAGLGALRAVAVGGGRSVAVKPLRGAPVLRDLLREHFRGCAAVLVAGGGAPADAPALAADGESWTVRSPGAAALRLGAEELVRRLRRPRPWGGDGGAGPDRGDPSLRPG